MTKFVNKDYHVIQTKVSMVCTFVQEQSSLKYIYFTNVDFICRHQFILERAAFQTYCCVQFLRITSLNYDEECILTFFSPIQFYSPISYSHILECFTFRSNIGNQNVNHGNLYINLVIIILGYLGIYPHRFLTFYSSHD